MTWTIETGYYEDSPPREVLRVWRMHPPPWKLIFSHPNRELVEAVVSAHNGDLEAAGEIPQLGLMPRRAVVRALVRLLEVEPEQFTEQERRWIRNVAAWLRESEIVRVPEKFARVNVLGRPEVEEPTS